MIANKHIAVVAAVLVCLSLVLCGFIVYGANAYESDNTTEYQKRLFGDEVITLDIQVDKDEWQGLLDNATAKEWISGDLIINGERFSAVGIRTKGNSSLSMGGMGAASGNERYSLQFKFNKYVKGQTYYGLDAFCVNNMMGDATYMKDYISYEIMNFIGVNTPLTNFAAVTVNGEDYGFCLALERYDKAFLDRVYGTSGGELYSVKISMGQRGDFEDRWQNVENAFPGMRQGNRNSAENNTAPDAKQDSSTPELPQAGNFGGMGGGMGGMSGMGGGGGSLVYTGDDPSGYSAIFDNAVFGTVSDKDTQRVITAIKNLNDGTDLEKYFDVDEILRYFAAHTVVVNLDSYISNMQQNYYIYERNGKITVLPWDYGLAFGGYMSGTASSVVNFPIDTPVSGVDMEDRPLLNKLLEVDEYREKYHEYLRQICEGYFESGRFEDTINGLDAKIGEYVKNDVSAYFTYEQYKASLPELIKLGNLRAESIMGQLDGTIPSTSAGQNADASALIDASSVNISALGSMSGGGGMGQGGQQPGGVGNGQQNGGFGMQGGDMLDMELMMQVMQIIMSANGEITEEIRTQLLELGLTEEQIAMYSAMTGGMQGGNAGGFSGENRQNAFPNNASQNGMPQSPTVNNTGNAAETAGSGAAGIITVCGLLLILTAAIFFVAKPRRTDYNQMYM